MISINIKPKQTLLGSMASLFARKSTRTPSDFWQWARVAEDVRMELDMIRLSFVDGYSFGRLRQHFEDALLQAQAERRIMEYHLSYDTDARGRPVQGLSVSILFSAWNIWTWEYLPSNSN